jgi:hypothetical protein
LPAVNVNIGFEEAQTEAQRKRDEAQMRILKYLTVLEKRILDMLVRRAEARFKIEQEGGNPWAPAAITARGKTVAPDGEGQQA